MELSQLAQPTQIPWGHHQAILNKCKQLDEALYYVYSVSQHNWSRSVLVHQTEGGLYQRQSHATTSSATSTTASSPSDSIGDPSSHKPEDYYDWQPSITSKEDLRLHLPADRPELIARFEHWWDKYHVSLHELDAQVAQAEAVMKDYLQELGYE